MSTTDEAMDPPQGANVARQRDDVAALTRRCRIMLFPVLAQGGAIIALASATLYHSQAIGSLAQIATSRHAVLSPTR